jgi:hypothetical protein
LPLPAAIAHPTKSKKVKTTVSVTKGRDKLSAEAEEPDLLDALDSADCGRLVALAIVGWFGERVEGREGRWKFEVDQVVRELGIVLLADGGVSLEFRSFLLPREPRGTETSVRSLVSSSANNLTTLSSPGGKSSVVDSLPSVTFRSCR